MLMVVGIVGDNIKRLRIAAGHTTQRAFAKALGIEQPRLSDWENGRYVLPDTPSLLLIGKTLGVSIDEIIEGFDPEYDERTRRRTPSATLHLTAGERELIELWRHADQLPAPVKKSIREMLVGGQKKQRHSA